ncbi:cytochrome c [Edaphobacter sp. HDX4]|uniref:c-type cytochrome n=1 Tax=Edaphobacter sp. HDX4 TaxID=2794064 RepID=UPI002FE629F7
MIAKAKTAVAFALLLGCGLAITSAAVTSLIAQSPQPAETAAPDSEAVARGQASFGSSCGFCHGSKATGTEQAPNLTRSPLVTQDHEGDKLGPFLKEGRPSLGMPSFASLQPTQVSDIAAFLHNQLRTTRRNRLPETALLVGNAEAGKAYYNGSGKCNSCHSVTGDLAGIGGKLQPLALTTSFLTPPAQPIKVSATVPSGKVVTGTLEYIDEFTISMNDTSGLYHTWPRKYLKDLSLVDPLATHKKQLLNYTDKNIHDLLAYLVTIK